MESRKNDALVILTSNDAAPEAAVLCSTLCDDFYSSRWNNKATRPVVRVVAECPERFMAKNQSPLAWKCYEKDNQGQGHLWSTYLGTPDVVLPISEMREAITGRTTLDDGSMAHSVIVCADLLECSSREIMKHLLETIESIRQQEGVHLSFAIAYNGSFRELSLFSRFPLQSEGCEISLGAFLSPLRFCQIQSEGIALSVTCTCHHQPRFLATRASLLWNTTCRWMAPSSSKPIIFFTLVQPNYPTLLATSMYSFAIQLQDPSLVLLPCLLASEMISKQKFPCAGTSRMTIKLVISMLDEIYRLVHKILDISHSDLIDDSLLSALVGNQTLLELTDNTWEKIRRRLSSNRETLRCSWLLGTFILRTVRNEYFAITEESPVLNENNIPKRSVLLRLSERSVFGLHWILSIARALGVDLQKDLYTITGIVKLVQPLFGETHLRKVKDSSLLWHKSGYSSSCLPRGFWLPPAYSFFHDADHVKIQSKI